MTRRAWGNAFRTTLVCIDSYEKGAIRGWFYNDYVPEKQCFGSLLEFLQKMECTLDTMDFPRAFNATRTFAPLPRGMIGLPADQRQTGKVATFSLRVLFRQNASWQGSVTWLEGKQEQSFRSVLELLLLMSTAMEEKTT